MLISAHTGCDQTPDNSLEYLDYVLTTGADGLEVDIRMDSNGFLYLSHDKNSKDRTRLEEVFSRLQKSEMFCNCDLKESGIACHVLELAKCYRVEDQICFTGDVEFSLIRKEEPIRKRTLINLQPIIPKIGSQLESGYIPSEKDFEAVRQVLIDTGGWAVNVPYRFCTDEMLSMFRSWGISVSAWIVDEEDPARKLVNADIYNITTRNPKMLLRIREEAKKKVECIK
jgi:hypothetical protein